MHCQPLFDQEPTTEAENDVGIVLKMWELQL